MFNFFKKEKKKGIINEIHNNKVIYMLADYGVSLLTKEKDYDDLGSLKCIFGYCITGDDGELNSLFKIETDKTVAYYQALRGTVTRLTITEEMFIGAIDIFFSNNKDLKKEIVAIKLEKND